jgi:hypothetical protein
MRIFPGPKSSIRQEPSVDWQFESLLKDFLDIATIGFRKTNILGLIVIIIKWQPREKSLGCGHKKKYKIDESDNQLENCGFKDVLELFFFQNCSSSQQSGCFWDFLSKKYLKTNPNLCYQDVKKF